jgi:DNA-binding NarL/FixJ family response regulator
MILYTSHERATPMSSQSTAIDTNPLLDLIESIEDRLKQLRGLIQPQAAPACDPRDPQNKGADGKLTPRGVEICYRLFEAGKTRYGVAVAMGISHKAASHRHGAWKKAGGANRTKMLL